MVQVEFKALIKQVKSKALVSLDKSYEIILQGEAKAMGELVKAPSDEMVEVVISYG